MSQMHKCGAYSGLYSGLKSWEKKCGAVDMIQEVVKGCGHDTGDGQRLQTWYRRWSKAADMVQEMVRDCGHDTRDGQRLWT